MEMEETRREEEWSTKYGRRPKSRLEEMEEEEGWKWRRRRGNKTEER